jgi:hypothetical protein
LIGSDGKRRRDSSGSRVCQSKSLSKPEEVGKHVFKDLAFVEFAEFFEFIELIGLIELLNLLSYEDYEFENLKCCEAILGNMVSGYRK